MRTELDKFFDELKRKMLEKLNTEEEIHCPTEREVALMDETRLTREELLEWDIR